MKKIYWLSIYVLSILFASVLSASAFDDPAPKQIIYIDDEIDNYPKEERFIRNEIKRCWKIVDTLIDDKPYVYNDEESTYISHHCAKQLIVRDDENYTAEDVVLTSSDENIVKILDNNLIVAMSRHGNALVTAKDKQGNELFSINIVTTNKLKKISPLDFVKLTPIIID